MIRFKEVSEERFDEMLGVLPPALHLAKGFLVGEAWSYHCCKVTGVTMPNYAAFVCHGGRYFEALAAMTIPEFCELKVGEVEVVEVAS